MRLIMTKLSTQEKFTPAFAKPMLCDVPFSRIFLNFCRSFEFSRFLLVKFQNFLKSGCGFFFRALSRLFSNQHFVKHPFFGANFCHASFFTNFVRFRAENLLLLFSKIFRYFFQRRIYSQS